MADTFAKLNVSPPEIERFVLDNAVMRCGFDALAAKCARRAIPLEIVSGGLDIYINPLLGRWGIKSAKVYCGKALKSGGGYCVKYPDFKNMPLDGFKAERVKALKDENRRVVFCGDGPSDFCGGARG